MTGRDPQAAVAVWAILDDADRAWCRHHPHDTPVTGNRLVTYAAALVEQGVAPVRTDRNTRVESDHARWERANLRALVARLVHAVTGEFDPHGDLTEQASEAAATARATRRATPAATGSATSTPGRYR